MPKLIFTDERGNQRSIPIVLEKTTVGRGAHNGLCIPDPSLSREHCEILTFGPEVIVRDLGSRNGTFVDGRRLSGKQCQLKHGQIVTFGTVQARLEIELPASESNSSEAFPIIAPDEPLTPVDSPFAAAPDSQDQTLILARSALLPSADSPSSDVVAAKATLPPAVLFAFLAFCLLLVVFLLLQ